MSHYDPRSLPQLSAIRIFRLGESVKAIHVDWDDIDSVFTLDRKYGLTVLSKPVFITGKNLDAICDVWRSLPEADQARCHMPVFGLYMMVGPNIQIHTRASICWQCNNIIVAEKDARKSYGFNSQSNEGQALFRLLTAHTEEAKA